MSSREPATVSFSLAAFAGHGQPEGPNHDGWGIGYFDGGDVRLFREPEPAGDSELVRFIERHRLEATTVVSHIRHATRGARALRNTQPFARELGGRMHLFAHNGDLPGIEGLLPRSLRGCRPIGETDSEIAFCLLLERMRELWLDGTEVPPLSPRIEAFVEFVERVRALGPANILYSDGEALFVHGHRRRWAAGEPPRAPGLHLLHRGSWAEAAQLSVPGLTVRAAVLLQEVMLVASAPLTGEAWVPLGDGEVVVLVAGQVVAAGRLGGAGAVSA